MVHLIHLVFKWTRELNSRRRSMAQTVTSQCSPLDHGASLMRLIFNLLTWLQKARDNSKLDNYIVLTKDNHFTELDRRPYSPTPSSYTESRPLRLHSRGFASHLAPKFKIRHDASPVLPPFKVKHDVTCILHPPLSWIKIHTYVISIRSRPEWRHTYFFQ